MNTVLSDEKRSIAVEAGYYEGGNVSTTTNPVGNITFTHHVHSLTSTTDTIEDKNGDAKGYGTDSDYSDTKGGCYQDMVYEKCGKKYTASVTSEVRYTTTGQEYYTVSSRCPVCGTLNSRQAGYHAYDAPEQFTCTGKKLKGYKASCGYSTGQIIKAEIIY